MLADWEHNPGVRVPPKSGFHRATASSELTRGTRQTDIGSVGDCGLSRTCSRNVFHSLGYSLVARAFANSAQNARKSRRIHTPFSRQDYRRGNRWLCRAPCRLDGNIDSAETAAPSEPKTNLPSVCLCWCCCYVGVHSRRRVATFEVGPPLDNVGTCNYGALWFIPSILLQVVLCYRRAKVTDCSYYVRRYC